jgi:hypothetical protein
VTEAFAALALMPGAPFTCGYLGGVHTPKGHRRLPLYALCAATPGDRDRWREIGSSVGLGSFVTGCRTFSLYGTIIASARSSRHLMLVSLWLAYHMSERQRRRRAHHLGANLAAADALS